MSKSTLLQEIVNYLQRQKELGKKTVYRTAVYAVLEDRVGPKAIGTGKAMTKAIMSEAASQTGGAYLSDEGRARIVF